MSQVVDKKVVEMQFDNRQFESGVQTSMSTLEKLKKSLNLDGAAKGLETVNAAAKDCDMSGISKGVETVKARFSALQVTGITALANIANSAVNAGKRLVSSFTIDPIKDGFAEYETQINSIQTILANTSHQGTTLKQVKKALNELNTYADKTIYNFTEMTRNIGTFTAAGLSLKDSTKGIQGIANLAAVSGSTSQQASTAMYQLSQALAAGRVQLMDWNSVVNAGMGGKVFQDAIIKTAEESGKVNKNIINAYKNGKNFRSLLSSKDYGEWFTSDILSTTLSKFTKTGVVEYMSKLSGISKKNVKSLQELGDKAGFNSKEFNKLATSLTKGDKSMVKNLKDTLSMASTAEDAATKVKTFTQLMSTLKEAAGSGWTQTWQYIIGDFEEAKGLWTNVSNELGDMINASAEARNDIVEGWAEDGGRDNLISSITNAFKGLMSVIEPIKKAFKEIFPPITSERLIEFTENLKSLTEKMKLSEERADKVKRIFKGVFSIFDIGRKVITAFIKPFYKLSQSKGFNNFTDSLLESFASIGDVFTSLNKGLDLSSISDILSSIASVFSKTFSGISKVVDSSLGSFKGFKDVISSLGTWISTTFTKVCENLKPVFAWINEHISLAFSWIKENVSIKDVFAGLIGGGVLVTLKKFAGLIDKVKDTISNLFNKKNYKDGIGNKFKSILDSVHDTLESFTSGIKISSLVSISVAVGILTASLNSLAKLNVKDLTKGLVGVGSLLVMMSLSFRILTKTLTDFKSEGAIKSGVAMITMSVAIKILANALTSIAKLRFRDVVKGLATIEIALLELIGTLKMISKTDVSLKTTASMILIAMTCKTIATVLADIGSLSWEKITKGLVGMGGALAELGVVASVLGKFGAAGSVLGAISMLIMAKSLKPIGEILKDIGSLSWEKITKGLVGMGGALAELGVVSGLLGTFAGVSSVLGATSILIMVQSLKPIGDRLKEIGSLSWDQIKKSLVGMGGALAELGTVAGYLGVFGGFKSLLGATSILIMVQALEPIADALIKISSLSWYEIKLGLAGIVGVLSELTIVARYLGKSAGLKGLVGASTILLMVQSLEPIGNTLSRIGNLSWDTIKNALKGMGFALAELSIVAGKLGKSAGLKGLIGASSVLIMVQSLEPICNSLIRIGSLSWDQIKIGLTGIGGTLAELGIVASILGKFAGLKSVIGSASILIMVQGLDDIANALIKIGSMTWDQVKAGLTGMGGALTELTIVSALLGNLGGLGATLGAGTILLGVRGLGDLADAFKKFGEMPWDEIKRGLASMGGALGELSLGSLLNTLSGLGALSIAAIAGPLGTLADSIKKWSGVTIPENLGVQLGILADGVMKFTFGESGANSISMVATPLGTLADSVKKWTGIIIPENLGSQLKTLASGVKSFTFGGLGADAISTVATPLGILADSIKKWTNINIPEGLETQLSSISKGVQSFTWALVGGASINSIAASLGTLANSIKKWKDVKVPKNLETQLSSIAKGVKSFTWAFAGGWSLEDIVGPLGKLPDAIAKWKDINVPEGIDKQMTSIAKGVEAFSFAFTGSWTIASLISPLSKLPDAIKKFTGIVVPEGMEKGLKSIANGVKSFSWAFVGGESIDIIADPLGKLANGIKILCSVSIPKNIGDKLKSISNGIKSFNSIGYISSVSGSISSIANSTVKLSGINFKFISSGLGILVSSLKKISGVTIDTSSLTSAMTNIAKAARNMMNAMKSTIRSGKSSITAAMKVAMSGAPGAIRNSINVIKSVAVSLISSLTKVISGKKPSVTSAFKTLVSGASDAVKGKRPSMVSAGKYLGSGLVEGINDKQPAVYNAAFKLGQEAVKGERDGQKSHSPSKLTIQAGHWFGEGLIIGIGQMASKVYSAGYDAGDTAVQAMSGAIARLSDAVDSDIDAQPTIRPVLDLSDVRSGAGAISDLFNRKQIVGVTSNVNAISSMMNNRNQNAGNADVIDAINKLRKDVGNIDAASYTIGGITYDNGSSISEAIKSLVDAARMERRM